MKNKPTYKIIRGFFNDHPKQVIRTGLTLREAQRHCSNPETSSKTATSELSRKLTEEWGPWFDGFEEE